MWASLSPEKRRFIQLWVVGLVVLYSVITSIAISVVLGEKHASTRNHALRMSADQVEAGLTPPDPLPPTGDFITVNVGVYLDNIEAFSIRDSYWTPTFTIWFRWKGDKNLDPAKHFQMLSAKIDKREPLEQHFGEDGTNYQSARVTARITKFFNTTRVPLDDHLLTIGVEDGAHDATRLRYVADPESDVSSRVKIPGYSITGFQSVVKPHTYRSSLGDPRLIGGTRKTYTEFVLGVSVRRASMGLYFKLLVGLFAGISLTLCSFFIRPSDTSPRYSLPTASYFGAVANSYLVGTTLPSTGQFGLIDYVTSLGLFTIFICMSASLVSGYFYLIKKDEAFSKVIDRSTRSTVLVVYLVSNITLPLSAFANF